MKNVHDVTDRAAQRAGIEAWMTEQGRAGRLVAAGLVRDLRAGPPASWSDLATRYGFADQAHLIRETRALTGHTPTALTGPATR